MLCKKCGNNVKSDFKYCPYCGERIVSDFHDHYEELTPPFLVREPDEPDAAADWYAAAPGERAPDFALPPTAAPEEPPLAPGAFPQEDLEDDLAPPHFRVSLPEEPAPGGYGGPLFGADHRGGADRRGSGVLVRIPPAGRRTRALPEYRLFSDVCAGLRSVNI